MDELKVRMTDEGLVVHIPSDLAKFYKLEDGDTLKVAREEHAFRLQPERERLGRQLDRARTIMDENAKALDLLAR